MEGIYLSVFLTTYLISCKSSRPPPVSLTGAPTKLHFLQTEHIFYWAHVCDNDAGEFYHSFRSTSNEQIHCVLLWT